MGERGCAGHLDVICDVLEMEDDASEAAAVPDVGPAVALAAPRPTAPAAQHGTRRDCGDAAALQGANEVEALKAKGKMAAASAKLQTPPLGSVTRASQGISSLFLFFFEPPEGGTSTKPK